MNKRKNTYFTFLNIIITIAFFLSLNIKKIKADEEICNGYQYNNNNNRCQNTSGNYLDYCKPSKAEGNWKCYDCSGAFQATNTYRRYKITNEHVCEAPGDCKKIRIESNECLDNCPEGTYEFGDYCYNNCSSYGLDSITGESQAKCKCPNNYKILNDQIGNNKYYRCIESCPKGYFNVSTNICLQNSNCGDMKGILYPNDIGCVDSCKNNNNKKLYKKEGTSTTEQYCVDTCPDSVPFFYNNQDSEEIECIDKCNDHDYYNPTTKECLTECNGISLIDLSKNIRECRTQDSTDGCPDSFPYRYNQTNTFACLKDCSDTKTMFDKDTLIYFEYIEGKPKRYCINIDECQQKAYFIDNSTKMCVKDCRETQNIYNFNGECFSDCTPRRYHLYDTFECQVKCPDGNYTSESKSTC